MEKTASLKKKEIKNKLLSGAASQPGINVMRASAAGAVIGVSLPGARFPGGSARQLGASPFQ